MPSGGHGEAIILGSGTSNGVPMIGVEYPPEFLANPKNHRSRACLLLKGPTGNLLVDCPPELRLQLTGAQIYDIEATLLTHTHADHVMGMDDLRSLCIKTGKAMPVYTTPEYQEDVRRIFPYAFKEFPKGIMVPRFDLRDRPDELEVGGLTVKTFLVWHGPMPVIGVRVNDFAYVTDVSAFPEEAEPFLKDLDVLVVDAVRHAPHPNHFHLDKALAEIARLKPRQAFLTHLCHEYDHDVENASLPNGVQLAFDGLVIPI